MMHNANSLIRAAPAESQLHESFARMHIQLFPQPWENKAMKRLPLILCLTFGVLVTRAQKALETETGA